MSRKRSSIKKGSNVKEEGSMKKASHVKKKGSVKWASFFKEKRKQKETEVLHWFFRVKEKEELKSLRLVPKSTKSHGPSAFRQNRARSTRTKCLCGTEMFPIGPCPNNVKIKESDKLQSSRNVENLLFSQLPVKTSCFQSLQNGAFCFQDFQFQASLIRNPLQSFALPKFAV
ncbi:hypothetical protein JTE90_016496 [Oedothorax gibbosus]|uniref:Uncharacterized protein n=1 Tax=Oedothorax gibbosus TaxID=931172 RepID=A0AAV6U8C7_9ARAC|nr:hypothetical protein JTE90_016496 [Oedothorax gibbosus]